MDNIEIEKMKDPKYYLENFCKIKGKIPGLVPVKLNEVQKDLFNVLRKNNRVICNKARQLGTSTGVVGYIYHKTITNPGFTSVIVGYNSALTAELLDKVKTFWGTTPLKYRPKIKYNSKYEISFPVMDSKMLVLSSGDNLGRGYSIHAALLTELPFWEKAEEKMIGIESSVPIDGLIVIESTPFGVGDLYHRMCMQAPNNGYKKVEYGWWWGYSEQEIEIIKRRINNPRKFAQDYSLEFLASGRNVFDPDVQKKHRHNIWGVGKEIEYNDPGSEDIKKWTVRTEDELRIYKPPYQGGLYVQSADTSEGIDGGDFSAVTILDRKTGEEVAFFRGLKAPDRLGYLLDRWGRKYNNALTSVEVNNHGLTTLTILKQLMYPSLYFRPKMFDQMGQLWSDRIGWKTTGVTRPLMIDDLAQAMRDEDIIVHSKETLDEMMLFIYDKNNRPVPSEGGHDDCIMCLAVGLQAFKVMYDKELSQLDYKKYLPRSINY